VLLTVMMAIVAIAVDGGMLMAQRRQVQGTADAAAMAAACVLYQNYPNYLQTGSFPVSTARKAALDVALANGIDSNASNTQVTVNIPPLSGPYADQTKYPGCAEVIINYPQPRSFSNIFGLYNSAATGSITVSARTVARGAWIPVNAGIIVLNYSGKQALNAQGTGSFTDVWAKIIVNSNDPAAAYIGGGGSLRAPRYDITGGDAGKTSQFLNASGVYDPSIIFTGVHPTPDPLAYLPIPGQTGAPPIPSAGTITSTPNAGGGTNYTLTPGAYGQPLGPKLPNFTNGDTVTFQQASVGNNGIYYLASGGLNSSGANLLMDPNSSGGIMFYNAGTGTNDGIGIQGNANGTVNLSPLQNGIYQNIMFFQARNAPETLAVAGNGSFTITGVFYVSDALLQVTGNGGTSTIGSQYISLDLTIAGNANVAVGFNPNTVPRARTLTIVE
jgi:Putative Flp pilus-assembly TadE/G-like